MFIPPLLRMFGILLILSGIFSGILGLRSYLRDEAYARSSVVVPSSVKWAQVKPNPWKSTVSIKLMLNYLRDGYPDSLEHNYSLFYSQDEPLPSAENLKAASPPVRYLPKEKRTHHTPDWVMVSNKDRHDGIYGRTGFTWMFNFLCLGFILMRCARVYQLNQNHGKSSS